MKCPDCQGTGVVLVWNVKDDSGDSPEICGMCSGYGHIALVDPK